MEPHGGERSGWMRGEHGHWLDSITDAKKKKRKEKSKDVGKIINMGAVC